ncbi:MAG: hypothetical protein ABUS79_23770 [Pseudomonadota bacterium]
MGERWWRRRPASPVPLALATSVRALLVALTAFAPVGAGCLSNEYRIPQDELRRLAMLPAQDRGDRGDRGGRGHRVRVVQSLGQRRDEAVDPDGRAALGAETEPAIDGPFLSGGDLYVGDPRWHAGVVRAPGGGGAPARVAPTVRGAPPAPTGAPVRGRPGRGGGGGGLNMGGCCGGGGGDGTGVLVAMAAVVVGAAFLATVGLAASEGARFDGYASVAPDQYLYLKDQAGRVTESSIATLSPEQVATTVEATIMDDEGTGLRRLDKAPLNRRGGVFKLDLGTSAFRFGPSELVGPMAHIQAGFFVTRQVGILAEAGLSGGSDCCLGTIVRHSLALEVDVLPVALGPVHAGVFGKGGVALVGTTDAPGSGPLAGGGAIIEIDLTPRMALVLRGGANSARLDTGWSSAATLTAGLAIY